MTNEERMALLRTVFNTIFQSKTQGTDITQVKISTNTGQWPGRLFNGGLRGFDYTINLGDRIINLRCLEQNPNKVDNFGNLKKYANLARQGHLIMWVIDSKNNQFLGRIHNGVWHASFIPATQPAVGTPNVYDSPEQEAREDAAYNQINQEWHNTQNAAASQTEPMDIDELPEIPNGVDIPDYVFDQIANMDEPPAWDE